MSVSFDTTTFLTKAPSMVSVSKQKMSIRKLIFPSGIFSNCSKTNPFSVFGPSVGNIHPVALFISRIVAPPSISNLSGDNWWISSAWSAISVVKSPTISSKISSRVTKPCTSPYSSTQHQNVVFYRGSLKFDPLKRCFQEQNMQFQTIVLSIF